MKDRNISFHAYQIAKVEISYLLFEMLFYLNYTESNICVNFSLRSARQRGEKRIEDRTDATCLTFDALTKIHRQLKPKRSE